MGFVPPAAPGGREGPFRSCTMDSLKVTLPDLKPTVFTFAIFIARNIHGNLLASQTADAVVRET